MEDVKEPSDQGIEINFSSGFNPCFNGRCKRTNIKYPEISEELFVSILVLMEDVKEPVWEVYERGRKSGFQSLF
mgnify:CR=1 FL=1